METGQIPGVVKRGLGLWDAKLCVDFVAALLEWLKGVVGEEEGVVWRVRWREGGEGVECVKTGEEGFLERGFVEWREELRRREEGVV